MACGIRPSAERPGMSVDGVEYHPDRLRADGTIRRHVGATKAGRRGEVLK